MGTRSLTFVYDGTSKVMCMYRQFDGYPSGHGAELASFLGGFDAVVNGYAFNETRKVANGMGCLAAQLVANFKLVPENGVGGFYLYPTNSKDCGQEYEYHVYAQKVVVKETYDGNKTIFTGTWAEFAEFCQNPVTA
jgi:hypothetical protein